MSEASPVAPVAPSGAPSAEGDPSPAAAGTATAAPAEAVPGAGPQPLAGAVPGAGAPPPAAGTVTATLDASSGPEPRTGEERLNLAIIIFLGLALLALVGGVVGISVARSGAALPDGLTSLASLIAGGLVAFLNPLSAARRNRASVTSQPATPPPAAQPPPP
jgi:hypothetical protein